MISKHVRYQAIVHYKRFGGTMRRVAKQYGVSKSSVCRWVNLDDGCGSHDSEALDSGY